MEESNICRNNKEQRNHPRRSWRMLQLQGARWCGTPLRSKGVAKQEVDTKICYECNLFMDVDQYECNLWMDVGTAAKNNRRYISLTEICSMLGSSLCAALPGFHALTGSNYTSSFVRKGKVRPFKNLQNQTATQNACAMMARNTDVPDDTKAAPHELYCQHEWS